MRSRRDRWGSEGSLWRRRRLILGIWIAVVLVAVPFAAMQTRNLSGGGFVDLDSQSAEVAKAIEEGRFPGVQDAMLAAVLVPGDDARPGDLRAAVVDVDRKVPEAGDVGVVDAERREALRAADAFPRRPVIMPLEFKGDDSEATDLAKRLRTELGIDGSEPGTAADGRVDVHVAGQGALWAAYQQVADESVRQAEARGFPIIGLILLLAFGSLFAAALPLTVGLTAVVITGAIVYALSFGFQMSLFVTSMASMIGIGVAVDYSLFVLVRYREEVRAGRSPAEARSAAMATSGRAVVLAGLTVVLSLAALFLINSPGIRSMAVGAIVVVAVSVLAASTLLVVVIGLLGPRAYEPGRLGRFLERVRPPRPPDQTFWARWSGIVMRRPALCAAAGGALLLAMAAPAIDLHVRNSAVSQLDPSHEIRHGIGAVESLMGPGALGPARVQVEFPDGKADAPANRRALDRVVTELEQDPLVGFVGRPRPSRDGRAMLVSAVFGAEPESERARDAVDRLRESLPAAAGDRADIAIGGTTAVSLDYDRLSSRSIWKLLGVVLALSFVVLLVLLRSLLLPLKAMLMNVLSVAAAYGVVVAVFQYGWLSFLGIEKAPSMYPTQPFVVAVAFGLSMDYHIFLLSRIRERYAVTGDNRRAVAEALASSGTPITSAALIMVAVFLSFVSAGAPSVQQLGVAAAVAIAVDASIARLVIVPAAMELLGKWNWWLPRPLARLLPPSGGLEPAPGAATPTAVVDGRSPDAPVAPLEPEQPRSREPATPA